MLDYTFNEECRPYVEHLLAEHRRLHRMIGAAKQTLGMVGVHGVTPEMLNVLRQMRSELEHHFTEEEQGGCLDEAVSYCPQLSGDVRRVEAEHPQLLAEIDRMIALAEDCANTVEARTALLAQFDDLCHDLHAHEAAENDLLRRGFGTNINGDEIPATSGG